MFQALSDKTYPWIILIVSYFLKRRDLEMKSFGEENPYCGNFFLSWMCFLYKDKVVSLKDYIAYSHRLSFSIAL